MLIGDVNSDVQTRLRMTLMSNIFAKTRSGNFMSLVPPYVFTLPIAWVQLLFKTRQKWIINSAFDVVLEFNKEN